MTAFASDASCAFTWVARVAVAYARATICGLMVIDAHPVSACLRLGGRFVPGSETMWQQSCVATMLMSNEMQCRSCGATKECCRGLSSRYGNDRHWCARSIPTCHAGGTARKKGRNMPVHSAAPSPASGRPGRQHCPPAWRRMAHGIGSVAGSQRGPGAGRRANLGPAPLGPIPLHPVVAVHGLSVRSAEATCTTFSMAHRGVLRTRQPGWAMAVALGRRWLIRCQMGRPTLHRFDGTLGT